MSVRHEVADATWTVVIDSVVVQVDSTEDGEAIRESTSLSKEAKSGMSARLMTDLTRHVPAATQVLASRLVLRTGVAASVCVSANG